MKTLNFLYQYKLEFDNNITNQQFQLRCIPRDGTHQKILDIDYTIHPVDKVTRLKDGFGNPIYVGSSLLEHNYFAFEVKGKVLVDTNPIIPEGKCYPIYKYYTKLTSIDNNLKALGDKFASLDKENKAITLMHEVYKELEYTPGITNINTSASEAYTLKKGVCQDYSHILITILRYVGIPARYVAGLMIGEGATHAWVEAYVEDHWLRLDPTNNKLVDDNYIKLAHGRDFNDCVIDKGTFHGNCNQTQSVRVVVKEEI